MNQADDYIDRVKHLPPEPTVLLRLLELIEQPDNDVEQIVQLICHDPSLAAEILRICNTAYFAASGPADDVFAAVTRLGLYEVYCVAASALSSRAFSLWESGGAIDIGQIWNHSIAAAVAADILAKRVGDKPGTAFTTALLHDLGKLVLVGAAPAEYAQVVEHAQATRQSQVEVEKGFFGVDHAEVGGRLLARWNFTPHMVAAVCSHHGSAPNESSDRLAATVRLGNLFAHFLGYGEPSEADGLRRISRCMGVLNLQRELLPDLLGDTLRDLKRLADTLPMQSP